jgi:hypothetical protein
MMIHLALSDLPDWTAGEELKRFAYVHLAPSFEVMAATYAQCRAKAFRSIVPSRWIVSLRRRFQFRQPHSDPQPLMDAWHIGRLLHREHNRIAA